MERCFYHVGPWRRAVPWLIFGPMCVGGLGLAVFSKGAEDEAVGYLAAAILLLVILFVHALISYARLELTSEGLRLRQMGMNLNVPWVDVAGLRLDRGREGFVTLHPMTGSGAANLAAVRSLGLYGNPLYNDEQRAVMAERRWVPIEAFAWHLRHGRLREDLARLAPTVQPLPSLIPEPAELLSPPERRRRLVIFLSVMAAIVAGIVVLGLGPPSWGEHFFAVALALLAPLLTVRAGWSARNAFRSGARMMSVVFVLLVLICMAWCLIAWGEAIALFGGGA